MNSVYAMDEDSLNKMMDVVISTQGITSYYGDYLRNTRGVTLRGDVAIISIRGIISRDVDNIMGYFGGVSIDCLAKDFQHCLDNENVKAIIFDIDSPGGHISGVNEFAEIIYKARGVKPIKAYVTGMACSAGYFIASACDEIVLDEMAQVGSIGVIKTIHRLTTNYTTFVSSQSPLKNPDANSKDGQDEYQSKVDYLASIFIDKVAKYRNMSSDDVINKGGKGGVSIGVQAVNNGLADRVGNMESLISELNSKKENIMSENVIDTASIEANAVAEERKRVADLMAIKVAGCEAIIKNAIEQGLSVAEANANIVAFIQSDEYKASQQVVAEPALEPVIAGADVPNISKEDTQVNSMIEFANSLK